MALILFSLGASAADVAANTVALAADPAQEQSSKDWFRSDYEDPFGEFSEPTAVLMTPGAPTLRATCTGKRSNMFTFQLDNSGENRRIEKHGGWAAFASAMGENNIESMVVKYAFGGERPKNFPMSLSEDGTEFLAAEARGYSAALLAERFVRGLLAYDSLILAVKVKGTDTAARYDLTGDTSALREILTMCKKKTWGRTAGKKKMAKQ